VRRHPFRLAVTAGLLVVTSGVVAGCSSAPAPGPVFNNEGAVEVTCLVHQTEEPGARYTAREMRRTDDVLALMRYYTAHGAKPFCDNAAPGESDKAWAQVYVDLGGTTEKVPTVFG
jgi:hypothetical protein